VKSIAKELLLVFIPKVLEAFAIFGISIYVVNEFGLGMWGNFSLFRAMFLFVLPVSVASIPMIIARDIRDTEDRETFFSSSVAIYGAFYLASASLIALGYLLSIGSDVIHSARELAFFEVTLLGAGLGNFLISIKRGLGDNYAYGKQLLTEVFTFTLTLVLAAWLGLKSYDALLLAFMLSKIVFLLPVLDAASYFRTSRIDVPTCLTVARWALPLVPSGIAVWVLNSSSRFVVNMFDPGSVGSYAVGYDIGYLGAGFISVSSFVFVPIFARRAATDKAVGRELFIATSLFVVAPCALYFLALVLFGNHIDLVFKVDHTHLQEIVTVARVIALSTMLFAITLYFQQLLISSNRQGQVMWTWMLAAVASLAVAPFLVGAYGVAGAATSNALGYVVAIATSGWFASQLKEPGTRA